MIICEACQAFYYFFARSLAQGYNGRHNVSQKSVNLVVYRFYCMTLFHSHTRRHVILEITAWSLNVFMVKA